MKNYELIIFDIDGTLTEIKPRVKKYIPKMVTPNKRGQQQPMAGVVEKLAELKEAGVKIALATNRGGVAWGFSTLENAKDLALEAAELCGIPDVPIYVCPYHAKAATRRPNSEYAIEHECRKPRPGMLLEAMEHFGISPENTLFVGDFETDEQAAENANVAFEYAETFF